MKKLYLLFLIVLSFFSTLSIAQNGYVHHWEMIVDGETTWRYMPGDSTPSKGWNTNAFNDSLWLLGNGGIGFGNNDDQTIIPATSSLYIRKKFTVDDNKAIAQLLLHTHFDDGFVAYLNGFEIRRENLGDSYTPLTHLDTTESARVSKLSQGKPILEYLVDPAQLHYVIKKGENTFAIEIHRANKDTSGITALFYLYAGLKDTTSQFTEVPSYFENPPVFDSITNLPIIYIHTNSQPINNDTKITATMGIVYHGKDTLNYFSDLPNHYNGYIGIENRGQSSLEFPKHSYTIETRDSLGNNADTSLIGMPKENDWVLYAPYTDKSLMRNVLTYQLWENMGNYAPRTRYCEFFLNDNYMGIYVLMEKIKIDKNRLALSKLTATDTLGNELTGGYLFKVDKMPVIGENAWYSEIPVYKNFSDLIFQYADPKDEVLHPLQKEYIEEFIETLQEKLVSSTDNLNEIFTTYIDKKSAIDKILITEFSKDIDSYKYSQYMYKQKNTKGGKLFLGPVWDYDLGYGNANYGSIQSYLPEKWMYSIGGERIFWFDRMMDDPTFQCEINQRWKALRSTYFQEDTLFAFINNTSLYLDKAQRRNHYKWKTLGRYVWPNYFVADTYEQEIDFVKNWIHLRLSWMDNELNSKCETDNIAELNNKNTMLVYPNPFTSDLVFYTTAIVGEEITFSIYGLTGEIVYQKNIQKSTNTPFSFIWDGTTSYGFDIPSGIYMYAIETNKGEKLHGKISKINL